MQNQISPRYIGVDVCKPSLDLDVPSPDDHIPNTPEAIAALLTRLSPDAHLVCEATGGYENALVSAALAAGVPISVLPPQRVRLVRENLRRPTGSTRPCLATTDASTGRSRLKRSSPNARS